MARSNLVLVGPRGGGKTGAGRRVADRFGLAFLDADEELERRTGRRIGAIFAEDGEETFRDLEQETLAALIAEHRGILATGGGAVLRAVNRERLRRYGSVVALIADPATLRRRLEGSHPRPSLTGRDPFEEIAEVLGRRLPLYHEVADAVVDTSALDPAEVDSAIVRAWRGEDGSPR